MFDKFRVVLLLEPRSGFILFAKESSRSPKDKHKHNRQLQRSTLPERLGSRLDRAHQWVSGCLRMRTEALEGHTPQSPWPFRPALQHSPPCLSEVHAPLCAKATTSPGQAGEGSLPTTELPSPPCHLPDLTWFPFSAGNQKRVLCKSLIIAPVCIKRRVRPPTLAELQETSHPCSRLRDGEMYCVWGQVYTAPGSLYLPVNRSTWSY